MTSARAKATASKLTGRPAMTDRPQLEDHRGDPRWLRQRLPARIKSHDRIFAGPTRNPGRLPDRDTVLGVGGNDRIYDYSGTGNRLYGLTGSDRIYSPATPSPRSTAAMAPTSFSRMAASLAAA